MFILFFARKGFLIMFSKVTRNEQMIWLLVTLESNNAVLLNKKPDKITKYLVTLLIFSYVS